MYTQNQGGGHRPPGREKRSTNDGEKMTNNATIETAKGLTFGTELEYTNITREKAAKAIHSVVGGTVL